MREPQEMYTASRMQYNYGVNPKENHLFRDKKCFRFVFVLFSFRAFGVESPPPEGPFPTSSHIGFSQMSAPILVSSFMFFNVFGTTCSCIDLALIFQRWISNELTICAQSFRSTALPSLASLVFEQEYNNLPWKSRFYRFRKICFSICIRVFVRYNVLKCLLVGLGFDFGFILGSFPHDCTNITAMIVFLILQQKLHR